MDNASKANVNLCLLRMIKIVKFFEVLEDMVEQITSSYFYSLTDVSLLSEN
jgi:hypothetical protein